MNILIYKYDIFPYRAIINAFLKFGHTVDCFEEEMKNYTCDGLFEEKLCNKIKNGKYDFVFSVNFFAIISKVCHETGRLYVAYNCDSPLLSLYNKEVFNEENYIFSFDYEDYSQMKKSGVVNAYYMPLACAVDNGSNKFYNSRTNDGYKYEVSFIGNLYDKNCYDEFSRILPPYLSGYLDAVIEAQLSVSGGSIIEKMLDEEWFEKYRPYINIADNLPDSEYTTTERDELLKIFLMTKVAAYKVSSRFRQSALNMIARNKVDTHIFTTSQTVSLPLVKAHKAVDYFEEAPEIFCDSMLSLNFTSPNIRNGIPLRVFDIMAAHGVAVTDYRSVTAQTFINGEEIIIYDGLEDLTDKVEFYTKNPQLRKKICEAGYKKIIEQHTYDNRIQEMIKVIQI